MAKMGQRAYIVGFDELLAEALNILTECALPPRERERALCMECGKVNPPERRKNAKYCSPQCYQRAGSRRSRAGSVDAGVLPPPAHPQSHIGSMWTWPEDQFMAYATREVGYRLTNYLRTRGGANEISSSHTLYNLALAEPEALEDARTMIEEWLEDNGVITRGDESTDELGEAVAFVREQLDRKKLAA